MVHVELKITSDDEGGIGYGEDCEPDDWCFGAVSTSGGFRSWWYFWAPTLDFQDVVVHGNEDLYSSPC
jgi:hypothetical protein